MEINRNDSLSKQKKQSDIANDIQKAVDEVKMMKQGRLPKKSARELYK